MTFSADLRRFRAMTEDRLKRIIVRSVADIMSGAQLKTPGVMLGAPIKVGRMPYYTTALVTSLVSVVAGKEFRGEFSYDSALARYSLGDDLKFYWNQPYAAWIENGDETFPGWHFMKTNAARWPDVVVANARKMRNRA